MMSSDRLWSGDWTCKCPPCEPNLNLYFIRRLGFLCPPCPPKLRKCFTLLTNAYISYKKIFNKLFLKSHGQHGHTFFNDLEMNNLQLVTQRANHMDTARTAWTFLYIAGPSGGGTPLGSAPTSSVLGRVSVHIRWDIRSYGRWRHDKTTV